MNQIIRLDLERGFTIDSGIWISRKTLTVRLSQFLLRSSLGLRMLPKNYFLPLTRQWPLGWVKGSLYLESLRDLWENCTAMVLHWQVAVWQRCTMNIIFFFSCSFCWEESKNISLSLEFNTFISICLDVHLFFFISQDFDVTFWSGALFKTQAPFLKYLFNPCYSLKCQVYM